MRGGDPRKLQLRKLANELVETDKVRKVAHTTVQKINRLLEWSNESAADKALRLHPSWMDNTSAGQVAANLHTQKEVIDNGNIREQMTLAMNFSLTSCDLIWKAVQHFDTSDVLRAICNADDIKRRKKRLEVQLGISFDNIDPEWLTDKTGFPSACHLASFAKSGSVMTSRQLQPSVRVKNQQHAPMHVRDICPPLSDREKVYMKLNKDHTGPVPWITGDMYWNTNRDSIHSKVFAASDRLQIAGPSGNTDLMLDLMLFFGIPVKEGVLACIAWMGNPIDHSLSEILIAANPPPYSLGYSIDMDPYVFVNNLLTEMRGVKGGKKPRRSNKIYTGPKGGRYVIRNGKRNYI